MMFEKMKVGICKLLVEIGTKHKKYSFKGHTWENDEVGGA